MGQNGVFSLWGRRKPLEAESGGVDEPHVAQWRKLEKVRMNGSDDGINADTS